MVAGICVTIGIFVVKLRLDLKKIKATATTSARTINDMVTINFLGFINLRDEFLLQSFLFMATMKWKKWPAPMRWPQKHESKK